MDPSAQVSQPSAGLTRLWMLSCPDRRQQSSAQQQAQRRLPPCSQPMPLAPPTATKGRFRSRMQPPRRRPRLRTTKLAWRMITDPGPVRNAHDARRARRPCPGQSHAPNAQSIWSGLATETLRHDGGAPRLGPQHVVAYLPPFISPCCRTQGRMSSTRRSRSASVPTAITMWWARSTVSRSGLVVKLPSILRRASTSAPQESRSLA